MIRIISNRMMYGIPIIMFFLSTYLLVKFPDNLIGHVLLIITFLIINWIQGKEALQSIRKCIGFLVCNTAWLGVIFLYVFTSFGWFELNSIWSVLAFILSYILVWIFVVLAADNQVAKLSTMIIGQACTIFYLIGSFVVKLIPNNVINNIDYDFTYLNNLGYSIKDVIDICLQMIFYPVLIIALTTYIIAELKDYKQKKKVTD